MIVTGLHTAITLATTPLSPSDALQDPGLRLFVWHTLACSKLFLGAIDVLEDLQPFLHRLEFMDIHQDRDATPSLGQDHRAPCLMNMLYERRHLGAELRQGADILIHSDLRLGDLFKYA